PPVDAGTNFIDDYAWMPSGRTGDRLSANYIGNFIRPGPSSRTGRAPIVLTDTADVRYFVDGNVVDGRDDLTADNTKLLTPAAVNGRALFVLVARPFHAPAAK